MSSGRRLMSRTGAEQHQEFGPEACSSGEKSTALLLLLGPAKLGSSEARLCACRHLHLVERTMAFSLYSATAPCFQQILGAMSGLIDKAETFRAEKDLAPDELIQARLAADMHPFGYQVKSTVVHSVGALEGIRKGVFSPDTSTPPDTFAGLKERVTQASILLSTVDPEGGEPL